MVNEDLALLLVKPDGFDRITEIIDCMNRLGRQVSNDRIYLENSVPLDKVRAFADLQGDRVVPGCREGENLADLLVTYLKDGPLYTVVYQGVDIYARREEVLGDTDPALAKDGQIRSWSDDSIERAITEYRAVHNIAHLSNGLDDGLDIVRGEIEIWHPEIKEMYPSFWKAREVVLK